MAGLVCFLFSNFPVVVALTFTPKKKSLFGFVPGKERCLNTNWVVWNAKEENQKEEKKKAFPK